MSRLSYSAIDSWLTCPKKYELERVLRVEQRPGWARIGGSAVHRATEQLDVALVAGDLTYGQEKPQ